MDTLQRPGVAIGPAELATHHWQRRGLRRSRRKEILQPGNPKLAAGLPLGEQRSESAQRRVGCVVVGADEHRDMPGGRSRDQRGPNPAPRRRRYRSRSCPVSPPSPRQITPKRMPNSDASDGHSAGWPNASGEYSTSVLPPSRRASAWPASRFLIIDSPDGISSSASTYHGPTWRRPERTSSDSSDSRSGRTRR